MDSIVANSEQLKNARSQIDEIDDQLLELLNRRAALAQQVAQGKKAELGGESEIVYYRPDREAQVLARVCGLNKGPFPDRAVRTIYREVISATLALEQPLKVAFVEQSAGVTLAAVLKHFGRSALPVMVADEQQALQSVVDGSADVAMVAIGDRQNLLWSESLAQVIAADVIPVGELWIDQQWQSGHQNLTDLEQSVATRVLIVGRQRCEPTGTDRSLLVVDGDSHINDRFLRSMLGPNLQLTCIDTSRNCWCLLVDGHLQDQHVERWVVLLNECCRSVNRVSSWPVSADDRFDG